MNMKKLADRLEKKIAQVQNEQGRLPSNNADIQNEESQKALKLAKGAVSQAMGASSKALSMIDIYEKGSLYNEVRSITGYLDTLWRNSQSEAFISSLQGDGQAIVKSLISAIEKSTGPERNLLLAAHRMMSQAVALIPTIAPNSGETTPAPAPVS